MSQARFAIPAVGAVSLLGTVYYFRSTNANARARDHAGRSPAQGKRDEALSGAGVGGTAVAGGHDIRFARTAAEDPQKQVKTSAPRDKLPSGGVGGGVGGGGANVRAIEKSGQKDPREYDKESEQRRKDELKKAGDEGTQESSLRARAGSGETAEQTANYKVTSGSYPNKSTDEVRSKSNPNLTGGSDMNIGQRLQGVFQQGGAKSHETGADSHEETKMRDTRIASNTTDTPTKNAAGGGKMH